MEYTQLIEILNSYGLLIVFVLAVAEYCNLPGLPATPILVSIGIWARANHMLALAIITSITGGLVGITILYWLGYFFGIPFMTWYYRKFPKHKVKIDNYVDKLNSGKSHYIAITRLIPVLRTLISIPAGLVKLNFSHYFMYSFLGIAIWNIAFIIIGSGGYEIFISISK